METIFDFFFRDNLYSGKLFIDDSEFPCLLFIILKEAVLTGEFGDEMTLRTDFEKLLLPGDRPEVREFEMALFNGAKKTAAFHQAKEKFLSAEK